MSLHNMNPFLFPFSPHTPTSPPAFIIHPQVPFGLPAFFLRGSNHFLLQLCASVGFPSDRSPSNPLFSSGALFYYPAQVKRSTDTKSLTLALAVLLSPASSRPPQLLPGMRGGDLLGMVSRSGEQQPVKCFIDHLVLRTFLCTLSSGHADGGPPELRKPTWRNHSSA